MKKITSTFMGIQRNENRKTSTGFRIEGKYFLGGLIFFFMVSIIVWVFGLRIDTGKNQKSSINHSPTPTPSYLLDTENDGVYTNYKYRYKFNYPVDIFDAEPKSIGEDNVDPYISDSWYMTPRDLGKDLFLHTYVWPEDKEGDFPWKLYNSFDEIESLPEGQRFLDGNGIIIRKISNNGVRGVVLLFWTPQEINYQLEYHYLAQFIKDDYKYSVGLISGDYQLLKENRKIFDEIIDSLEFMNQ